MYPRVPSLAILVIAAITFAGCSATLTPTATSFVAPPPSATATPIQPTVTSTPALPTPTPEPLAATVNGEGVSLSEYNAEIQRLQASLKDTGKTLQPADLQKQALDELINETLLAAAAAKAGYKLDDTAFQKHLDDLTAQAGGTQSLADWMKNNYYDSDSLKKALRRSMAATWERDQLTASVPTTADQVHARQMLLLDPDTANLYYKRLQAGTDFATLAYVVDPDTGGDLGWFPQGYLLLPEIEKTAFDLQPGQYSPIIKTAYGYQIIFMIERDSQHPLSTDARRVLQQQLLTSWLKEQYSSSKIEILFPSL